MVANYSKEELTILKATVLGVAEEIIEEKKCRRQNEILSS